MSFEIRPAGADDLDALIALYRHLNPADAPLADDIARTKYNALIEHPGLTVFCLFMHARMVSTATLIVIPNLTRAAAPYALIENVVTDPDFRGQGHGKAVVKHAVAEAGQAGCYKVMLLTGRNDPAVLDFYIGCGFSQSKTGFQVRFDA